MKNSHDGQSSYIRSYYEKNLQSAREHHRILGWENRESQRVRFDILLDHVPLADRKLVDFGCGMGDLLGYLREKGLDGVEYTGVDISYKLIEKASRLYPGTEFHIVDILEDPTYFHSNNFDVLYSSGVFNLKFGSNYAFFRQMFEIFYAITRQTIVFNLLSDRSTDKEDTYHYFSRGEIEDYLRMFPLRSIEIIDDYLINDFTVICEKVSL